MGSGRSGFDGCSAIAGSETWKITGSQTRAGCREPDTGKPVAAQQSLRASPRRELAGQNERGSRHASGRSTCARAAGVSVHRLLWMR